jgi:hypothetical protein
MKKNKQEEMAEAKKLLSEFRQVRFDYAYFKKKSKDLLLKDGYWYYKGKRMFELYLTVAKYDENLD